MFIILLYASFICFAIVPDSPFISCQLRRVVINRQVVDIFPFINLLCRNAFHTFVNRQNVSCKQI